MSEKVYISDLISAYSLRNTENRSLPVYSVTNSHGFTLSTEYFNKKVFSKDTSNYKIVPFGAFAYNPSRINVGSISWQDKEKEVIVSPLYNVFTFKHNVDARYLNYFFHSPYCMTYINAYATGSVRNTLDLKSLGKIPIILPEEKEQKRVVKILDCLIKIITHRKQALELMNELVKSRFVEMFGDPISNPKRWDTISLGNRCKIITGNTPSRAESENYGNFIEWIKSDNINTPFTLLTNAQECLSEIGFQKCRFVEAGSLLMTCIAGSINCIGNVAISNRRVAFNQQINAIVPEEDEVLYLYWLMLLSKPIIHHTINKSLKGILSKGQLSEISFPFPPREIQKQFVAFATQIDKSRLAIQKSLDETQLLFDSLMQKYFG